ncbi:hypothetical protein TWF281_008709 [Arthrobotrys megalospora]
MDITIILNAVQPKAGKSPKKGTKAKYPDHTLHVSDNSRLSKQLASSPERSFLLTFATQFAHEIIKASQHSETVSRWHWAILEKVELHSNVQKDTPEFEALCGNLIALTEAVWVQYYTGNEDEPKNRKHTIDEVYEDGDDGDETVVEKRRATKVASLSEMAETGCSFKLDWNSADRDVSVFKSADTDTVMIGNEGLMAEVDEGAEEEDGKDHMELETCYAGLKKENTRPISSPHSLRKRLLRKLVMANGVYARAA